MRGKQLLGLATMLTLATGIVLSWAPDLGEAGQAGSNYKVLAPISRGNLTIFPVVTDRTHDTQKLPDPR